MVTVGAQVCVEIGSVGYMCWFSEDVWQCFNQVNASLTGRREAWSPRCRPSSLQVEVVKVAEGAKAGWMFPQGEPLPLAALLLECPTIPTDHI